MDFEFDEEQERLRQTVRRFLSEAAPLTWVRGQLAGPFVDDGAAWKGLAELGLPGLLVPEEHGGAGLGLLEMGVVLEELGRALHPGPLLASALAATRLVLAQGSAEDRARWLPGLADGSRIGALAIHEPDARYDWAFPRTTALREHGSWRLHGEKRGALDAAAADLLFVSAAAEDGLGLFAVAADAPGLEVCPRASLDGTRKQADLVLAGAPALRVGVEDVEPALAEAEDLMAIGLAVDGVGAAARALELARDYALEREQFGRPIGAFQAVQHLLVDMLRELEIGRALAYYALWAAEAATAAERHRAASLAKAHASQAFPRIGESAIQVFGGVGFTWEMDVHLYSKRLLSLAHLWGDAGHHLDALARIAIDGEPEER